MNKYYLWVLSLLLALATMTICGCALKQAPATGATTTKTAVQSGTPVSVMTLSPSNMDEVVQVTGTLLPEDEVSVGTRAEGRIAWIIGKEGTPVHQGQVVARLEVQDAEAMLRSAQAAYHAAVAHRDQAMAAAAQQRTATSSGNQDAQAGLNAANARLQQANTTKEATEATMNAQLNSAREMLKSAQAKYDEVVHGSRAQEKAMAESAVRVAQANYADAKRNYERYKMLDTQGAIAHSILDSAATKLEVAQAQLDSAQQQLSLVKEGSRIEDIDAAKSAFNQAQEGVNSAKANLKQIDVARANVRIAETGVLQAEAVLAQAKAAHEIDLMRESDIRSATASIAQALEAIQTAKNTLGYTKIYSPVDGVVSAKTVDVGQSVAKAITVLRLTTNQALYFEAKVSELDAPRLHSELPVLLTVDALQGDRANLFGAAHASTIKGTVEKVVPVVDASTRNFIVRVRVKRSKQLFPGMFTRGAIITAQHHGVIAIPKDVIVQKGSEQAVFVAEKGQARKRAIVAGYASQNLVQIVSGLKLGEQIITGGQQNLQDGDAISVQHGMDK